MHSKLAIAALVITFVSCNEIDSLNNSTSELLDVLINDDTSMARTFGHNALKRLSFIFLPVMFTLGVISTLLLSIAIVSVKNLAIGVVLLIVGISQAVARLISATTAQPILSYSALHSRSENYPQTLSAVPWPVAAQATAPVYSPWARSDHLNAVER